MADNTELDSGAGGDSIRSVEKTGVKTQVVTLDVGGAGAESLVAGTVPVSGTVTAELSAADNSVLDDIAASVAGTLAVSNAGLTELAAAIDTEVQCDIVGALPAGTNAIGKLAANSGVDIGDVDVTSLPSILDNGTASAATVAASGLTTVATITTSGYRTLNFHFNVTTQNVDDFEVFAKAHASAEYLTVTPTSWASLPSGGFIKATAVHTTSGGAYADGDLNTVDAGQNGFFQMDVTGFVTVLVQASAAANSASVQPYWSLTK